MSPDLQNAVRHYLTALRQGDRDYAFHSLIELDRSVLPCLITEFSREPDPTFRHELLRVIAGFHAPETVDFFGQRLFDSHWKAALDFLVSQGTPAALRVLQAARERVFDSLQDAREFREWLEEAIDQATSRPR